MSQTSLEPLRAETSSARLPLWLRLVAAIPFPVLYAFAAFLGWLAYRVFPYRQHVVRENLTRAFPDLDEAGLRRVMRDYYAGFAQVLIEIVKSVNLSTDELRQRVRFVNVEVARELLEQGKSVVVAGAHQANWEWMLLVLSLELGCPVDAAYKPLQDGWAERLMLAIRTRLGARMIPSDKLLGDIIKRRGVVRVIALLADQEPKTAERKHWTRFLNRDSAFFLGPEEIAKATRLPVLFLGMTRTKRGFYEVRFTPLHTPGEALPAGEITERYVREVEAQIRRAPPDWPWSHKRWRLKKSLYG